MDEKQFQETVAALWQHVQAARVLQDTVGLPQHIIEQINCVTRRKLTDLEQGLYLAPRQNQQAA